MTKQQAFLNPSPVYPNGGSASGGETLAQKSGSSFLKPAIVLPSGGDVSGGQVIYKPRQQALIGVSEILPDGGEASGSSPPYQTGAASLTDPSIVSPETATLVGTKAYVASDPSGLSIVDITDPTLPRVLGSYSADNGQFQVAISGNHAFLPRGTFTVLDISNPASPTIAGSLTDTRFVNAEGILLKGSYAIVANQNDNRLLAVNISDLAAITIDAELTDAVNLNSIQQIVLVGNTVFAPCAAGNTFTSVDVTDPTHMSVLQGLSIANGPAGVAISGTLAYVVTGDGPTTDTLSIVDISSPSAMTVVGSVTDAALCFGSLPAYQNNLLYVPLFNSPGQITTVDVSDPTTPRVVGTYTDSTIDTTSSCWTNGSDYMYVCSGFLGSGANTFDVFRLAHP